MRTLTALRRRRTTDTAASDSIQVTPDPAVDPPMIAALVRPMLQLRSTLGSGATMPDRTITTALSAATTHAVDSESPHRDGLYALESTWTSAGADAAVPALRTTQTQIGEISDRGPAYLSVLSDAQATSARAARKVDQIIADFRADARVILANSTSAPETDAVIDRAAAALREAIETVDGAQTEMDGHTQRLTALDPVTVTTPAGLTDRSGGIGGTSTPTTYYSNMPSSGFPQTTADGQPLDPALIAQMQLQQQLISAGVDLGTAAITAGVDIGTHLIDKIVETGVHAMDTVATSADKVISQALPELINPGSTTTAGAGTSGGSPNKLFDFGGGTGPSNPSAMTAAPGTLGATPKVDTPKPVVPEPSPGQSITPDPGDKPVAQAPLSGNSEPSRPVSPGGAAGGMAMPPGAGGDQERKRDGQLGVTVPASEVLPESMTVPAAVIGDFGDDAP